MGAHSGLKAAYAGSIVLLIVLALATLASPLMLPTLRGAQAALPESGKVQVLAEPGEWVLQYNLVNASDSSGAYTFEIAAGPPAPAVSLASRVLHTSNVRVDSGRPYVFIYHLSHDQVPGRTVQFTVHRGGETAPLEELTLHLPPAGGAR